jgi:hypothetical protein
MDNKEFTVKNSKRKNYRLIHRSGVRNKYLSFKAKGVLWYLLDKPDGWHGQIYDIVSSNDKDGIKSVKSAIKELVEHGYVELKSHKKQDNKFQGKFYEVNENPNEN